MLNPPRLLLASQSPRRATLLQQIGIPFRQHSVDIDETPNTGEAPTDYVCRLAVAKAQAGWQWQQAQRQQTQRQTGIDALPVLGADTVVTYQQQIFGKPKDRDHGMAMLQTLSGETHQVLTAVCLHYKGEQCTRLSVSDVTLRPLDPREIEQYWHSDEPVDKAGGYAIQGMGAIFVEKITGSYSGIVGLPLTETHLLLNAIEKIRFNE